MEKAKMCGGMCLVSDDDVRRLSRVAEYIRDCYDEDISIRALSRAACMSPTKFKCCFRELYGVAVGEYVRRVRMAEAKRLLADGGMAISAVAHTVGYLKPGAFAAAFKRHTGMLPKNYRKLWRGGAAAGDGSHVCEVAAEAFNQERANFFANQLAVAN